MFGSVILNLRFVCLYSGKWKIDTSTLVFSITTFLHLPNNFGLIQMELQNHFTYLIGITFVVT